VVVTVDVIVAGWTVTLRKLEQFSFAEWKSRPFREPLTALAQLSWLQVVATVKKSPEIRRRNPERSFIVIVERSGKISRRLQNESAREHSQGNL
jgi:hypothetical protein